MHDTDGGIRNRPAARRRRCIALVLLLLHGPRAEALPDPRFTTSGHLDGLAVAPTAGGPRQLPQALLGLRLDALASPAISGHVEVRARLGGPVQGVHAGAYDFSHAFQDASPSLEWSEAHLDVQLAHGDVRAGLQKFAWGSLDGIPPTDILNPRDYRDPLVVDFEDRKIAIPALAATYYPPDVTRLELSQLRMTFVYVPLAIPSRLALPDERWFPASTAPPADFAVPRGSLPDAIRPLFPHGLVIPVQFDTANRRPPRALEDGGIALRVGGTWRETDWDIYHYTGPETGADADLRAVVVRAAPFRIISELRQAHDTIHMTGAACSMALGGATLRAEAAYFDDRPYVRLTRDVVAEASRPRVVQAVATEVLRRGRAVVPLADLFPALDAVEWGVGADYLVRGFMPLVQVNQIAILDRAPRLLIGDPETRVSVSLRKHWLGDRLEVELRGTYAVERGGWYAFPRVSYQVRDDLRLRLGYLAIGGSKNHLFGQFHDNDEVVMQARYTF